MSFDIIHVITVIVVIFFSMTLHEAMHAFMGYWLGDDTAKLEGRLSLNPIKHIDPFLTLLLPITLALVGAPVFGGAKPVPFNPDRVKWDEWGAALVALAGPLTNFLIAFVTFGAYVLLGSPQSGLIAEVLVTAVMVNLGFFVFNMIPIPPLDGSRVLYALAPEFVRRGMEIVERMGILVIFILVIVAGSSIGVFVSTVIDLIVSLFGHIFGIS